MNNCDWCNKPLMRSDARYCKGYGCRNNHVNYQTKHMLIVFDSVGTCPVCGLNFGKTIKNNTHIKIHCSPECGQVTARLSAWRTRREKTDKNVDCDYSSPASLHRGKQCLRLNSDNIPCAFYSQCGDVEAVRPGEGFEINCDKYVPDDRKYNDYSGSLSGGTVTINLSPGL